MVSNVCIHILLSHPDNCQSCREKRKIREQLLSHIYIYTHNTIYIVTICREGLYAGLYAGLYEGPTKTTDSELNEQKSAQESSV